MATFNCLKTTLQHRISLKTITVLILISAGVVCATLCTPAPALEPLNASEVRAAPTRANLVATFNSLKVRAAAGDSIAQDLLSEAYYYGRGTAVDVKLSLAWTRKSAAQGNGNAQSGMAHFYMAGKEVTQNYAEALRWAKLSAAQGNAKGEFHMGLAYKSGLGVEADDTTALKWYLKSAAGGYYGAQINAGNMYAQGEAQPNGKPNYVEALRFMRLAAAQNQDEGQASLAFHYNNGLGVKRDKTEAIRLYTIAAEHGHLESQKYLGDSYLTGDGVKIDLQKARHFYHLAAQQADADAVAALKDLPKK